MTSVFCTVTVTGEMELSLLSASLVASSKIQPLELTRPKELYSSTISTSDPAERVSMTVASRSG